MGTGNALVWAALLILLVFFVAYTAVLSYHWFRYSHTRAGATLTTIIYLAGASFFVLILFSAAAALTS